jgi:hypothetical protein
VAEVTVKSQRHQPTNMAEVAVKPQRHQPSEYTVGMTTPCGEVIQRRGILPESGRTFRKKECF